jgi:hypothetical protein
VQAKEEMIPQISGGRLGAGVSPSCEGARGERLQASKLVNRLGMRHHESTHISPIRCARLIRVWFIVWTASGDNDNDRVRQSRVVTANLLAQVSY